MAVLRGVASFHELWERRTSLQVEDEVVDLLATEDLIQAKKTQLDKDWPMIRRPLERHCFEHAGQAGAADVAFWLRELRTPELLLQVAAEYHQAAQAASTVRTAVRSAIEGDLAGVSRAIADEEQDERTRDRSYWEPLRRELEAMRRQKKAGQAGRPAPPSD